MGALPRTSLPLDWKLDRGEEQGSPLGLQPTRTQASWAYRQGAETWLRPEESCQPTVYHLPGSRWAWEVQLATSCSCHQLCHRHPGRPRPADGSNYNSQQIAGHNAQAQEVPLASSYWPAHRLHTPAGAAAHALGTQEVELQPRRPPRR